MKTLQLTAILSEIINTPQDNPKDVITLDVPLFIRLLEYAKEDAKDDMDLHKVSERIIALSSEGSILDMSNYDQIVAIQPTSDK